MGQYKNWVFKFFQRYIKILSIWWKYKKCFHGLKFLTVLLPFTSLTLQNCRDKRRKLTRAEKGKITNKQSDELETPMIKRSNASNYILPQKSKGTS